MPPKQRKPCQYHEQCRNFAVASIGEATAQAKGSKKPEDVAARTEIQDYLAAAVKDLPELKKMCDTCPAREFRSQ